MLDRPNPDSAATPTRREPSFLGKVLLVMLLVALAVAAWQLALVFILAFGAIIVAVVLDNLAAPVAERLRISQHFALALTTLGLVLVFVGFLGAFGARAANQFA